MSAMRVFVIDRPTGDPASKMRVFVIDIMLYCPKEKPCERDACLCDRQAHRRPCERDACLRDRHHIVVPQESLRARCMSSL